MKYRKTLLGTTAIALAAATGAQADVTAADVWANMQDFYTGAGYTLQPGSVTEAGGVITITDLVMGFPNPYADLQEEFSLDMSAALPEMVLEEAGDGTVMVKTPDVYAFTVKIQPEGEEAGTFTMSFDQTGMSIVASGEPELVSYAISGPKLAATIGEISAPGEADLADAIDATFTIDDIAGTYVVGSGGTPTLDMDLTMGALAAVVSVREPGGAGAFDANIEMSGLAWQTKSSLAQGDKPGDLSSMLKAGMTSDTTLAHSGSSYSIDFQDDTDQFNMAGSASRGAATTAMGGTALSYLISNTDMAVTMSGSEIPLPEVAANAASTAFGLTMPVIASESAEDMALTLRLEGFSVSDMIWGMIDPTATLPRDPANVILELAGKGNWNLDIMDPTAFDSFEGGLPGGLEALDIQELELSAAGASVTGTGSFTFDMNNLETFEGVPAPTGGVDLTIVGANGLMDKLVSMGLLPEDQAMGARMMMGLFARPGDGEDTLTSKIEVEGATGEVSANGQRLR